MKITRKEGCQLTRTFHARSLRVVMGMAEWAAKGTEGRMRMRPSVGDAAPAEHRRELYACDPCLQKRAPVHTTISDA